MKQFLIIAILLLSSRMFGQKADCICETDSLMMDAVSCDTIVLKNKFKLYWQLNCERIWLTLENTRKEKIVINEPDIGLANLTYRLGFHLIREFKNTLLFRSGCSSMGPCTYNLLDKNTGKQIREFGQLICIDTDSQYEGESYPYPYDFIVYLDYDRERLIVYFIDTKKSILVPFKERLTSIIPENQFDTMKVKNNILTISYRTEDNLKKAISINLDKAK